MYKNPNEWNSAHFRLRVTDNEKSICYLCLFLHFFQHYTVKKEQEQMANLVALVTLSILLLQVQLYMQRKHGNRQIKDRYMHKDE